ncbi:response regulator transcription factor [Kocuria palustris]|uniref:response regulator transcription factor n=1 Tax=Kocuria palustris TaxID=71999 RepID=UPI00077B7B96|nr:response regulator transcription factor [Kocuria palustris]
MTRIIMLADPGQAPSAVLPALDLLPHPVSTLDRGAVGGSVPELQQADLLLIDGRSGLVAARNLAQLLRGIAPDKAVIMVLTEGGLAAVAATWLVDDIVLAGAGPAELDARIRLASARSQADESAGGELITAGSILIDEAAYSAHVAGESLNLTFKEFELLKFLAHNEGRVFTRSQLLSEVWGYDYFGGTRTVDVHIRRLRAKLGPDHEKMVTTVRNVGYSLTARRTPEGR